MQQSILNYTIRDIMHFRALPFTGSGEFCFFTAIPTQYEPYFVNPDYYCFGLINSGSLTIEIDNATHCLTPNSLMVYRPGQAFKVAAIGPDTQGGFVLFTKKFLDSLNENIFSVKKYSFLSKGIPSLIELNDADRRKLGSTFGEVLALLNHISKPNWELVAKNLTSALIYETDTVLEAYINPLPVKLKKDDDLLKQFTNLVDKHFKTNRKLLFYAAKLCVSPNYLYAAVKRASGQNPTLLINSRVLSEAKYTIAYTSHNISEVAYYLNFSDPFAFSKFFKKHTGFTPSQYRELQQA